MYILYYYYINYSIINGKFHQALKIHSLEYLSDNKKLCLFFFKIKFINQTSNLWHIAVFLNFFYWCSYFKPPYLLNRCNLSIHLLYKFCSNFNAISRERVYFDLTRPKFCMTVNDDVISHMIPKSFLKKVSSGIFILVLSKIIFRRENLHCESC